MEKLILKSKDNNLLKVNYAKSLKDKDFLELVNKLEIDSNIKMKYTTRLNEATIEYKNCKNCSSLVSCKNNLKGFCLTPCVLDNRIDFSYIKCKFKLQSDIQTNYLKNVYFYEIPVSIRSASFKNIYKDDRKRLEIIKKIKSFYDNYKKQE